MNTKKEGEKGKEDKKKEDKKDGDESEEEGSKAANINKLDINIMPYIEKYNKIEKELEEHVKEIIKLCGIKESDTGLSLPSQWVLEQDAQLLKEHPLIVARCTKIIDQGTDDAKYLIHIRQ